MNNNLVNEQWRVINDFPMYEVSDYGKIRNSKTGRILKPYHNWLGYMRVCLSIDGKVTHKSIHRLVSETFIPNPENLPCVDHINGDKTDNRLCNLRWCTKKENANFDNHKPLSDELKAIQRENYYRNRESRLEYLKQYNQINKELLSEQLKQHYQNNKEHYLEYQLQYYQAHKEQAKQYREAHKEQYKDYMKLYYLAHKEQRLEYQKNYYKSRKD